MIKRRYVCLIIVFMLGCCSCTVPRDYPTEGIWYCEDLKMEIDFSCEGDKAGVKVYSGEEYSLFEFWTLGASIWIRPAGNVKVYLSGTFRYKGNVFEITTTEGVKYSFLRMDERSTTD